MKCIQKKAYCVCQDAIMCDRYVLMSARISYYCLCQDNYYLCCDRIGSNKIPLPVQRGSGLSHTDTLLVKYRSRILLYQDSSRCGSKMAMELHV